MSFLDDDLDEGLKTSLKTLLQLQHEQFEPSIRLSAALHLGNLIFAIKDRQDENDFIENLEEQDEGDSEDIC